MPDLSGRNLVTDGSNYRLNGIWQFQFPKGTISTASGGTAIYTPTERFDAISDLGMSGDPRFYPIYDPSSVGIPAGTSSVVLTTMPDSTPASPYPDAITTGCDLFTFKVGQDIRIIDGLAANKDLVTTITAINPDTKTITFSPATSHKSGYSVIQHDDTRALQTFLDNNYRAYVYFPSGFYPMSVYSQWFTGKDYCIQIPATSEAFNRQWHFQGNGQYLSGFAHSGQGHLFQLKDDTTINFRFEGFYVSHSDKTALYALSNQEAGAALYLASNNYNAEGVPQSGATNVLVQHNLFIGWKIGIWSDNLQSSVLRNNSFYYCNNGIQLVSTNNVRGIGSQTEANANVLDGQFIQYGTTALDNNAARTVTDAVTTAAHNTSGAATGHNASNVVTSATAAFTSDDLYRVVRILGAGVNQIEHWALIVEVVNSTTIKLSQPPWTENTGLTMEIQPRAIGNVFLQNASNCIIRGGTWQGNWGGENSEVYGIYALNLDELSVEGLWIEDNGGSLGAAHRYVNVRGLRIINCNAGANGVDGLGNYAGYKYDVILDNVVGGFIDGCYFGSTGTGIDMIAKNGTRGVYIQNTTLTSARMLEGYSLDSTKNFWPIKLGQGIRFLFGGGSDNHEDSQLLNDAVYGRNLITNGNFADGLNGWTQDIPAALAVTNTGLVRGQRYCKITPSLVSAAGYSPHISQTITLDAIVQQHEMFVYTWDWYLDSRGADAISSPPYYNEMRTKVEVSDGTNTTVYQHNVFASNFGGDGVILNRWERSKIVFSLPYATGIRTIKIKYELAVGANAGVYRIANGRLTYGVHGTKDEDEPITELRGGTLNTAALKYLDTGGSNQLVAAWMYRQTAKVTLNNTVVETTLLSGAGSLTIKANTLTAGSTFEFEAWGFGAKIGGTTQWKWKLGSFGVLLTSTALAWAPTGTRMWFFKGVLTVQTIGATGTISAEGVFRYFTANAATEAVQEMLNVGTGVFDTTIDQTFDFTAQHSAAAVGNTVSLMNATLTRSLL